MNPSTTSTPSLEQRLGAFAAARLLMKKQADDLHVRLSDVSLEETALQAHDALDQPWLVSWIPGTPIAALDGFPDLKHFVDHALFTGIRYARFQMRAGTVDLRTRTNEPINVMHETSSLTIQQQLAAFLARRPMVPSTLGGMQTVFETPLFPVTLIVKGSMDYVEGRDASLRILPGQPYLPADLAKLKASHQAQREQLVELIEQRRASNVALYHAERARELGPQDNLLHKDLFLAIEENRTDSVSKLLANGVNLKWRSPTTDSSSREIFMDTPLILAARLGHADMIQMLLPHSDIDAVNARGETALIACARNNQPDCVAILAPHSIVDAQDFTGQSALLYATDVGNTLIVRILAPLGQVNLVKHGHLPLPGKPCEPGHTALFNAVLEGQGLCIRALLDHGADPRILNAHGKRALITPHYLDAESYDLIGEHTERLNRIDEQTMLSAQTPLARRSEPPQRL